jgi:hypothetical protein
VAQANTAVKEGRLADSRDAWMAVWKLERSQVAACNVGALSLRIGDAPAAVRWLSVCKEIMRPPATAQERALHESRMVDLARARQLVGELRLLAPAGATFTVDGEPVEAARDKTVPVTPGRHIVRAELNGAIAGTAVDVPRGEARDVKLTFSALPSKRPRVAGRDDSSSRPGPRTGVVVAGFASSAAFLAAGSSLMVLAANKEEDGHAAERSAGPSGCFRTDWPMCRDSSSSYEDMRIFRGWGIATLVTGGVLAAGTLGYALFPRRQAEVVVSAQGIVVRGTW